MPPATLTSTAKRKKWTEEEERALISKYSELQSSGALSRLRTREKKFRPIADHVTAAHHGVEPTAYPFSWSWKEACTKAHNMRHQYLLVKQKLLSAAASEVHRGPDFSGDLNWADGLSLWPNFLRYKEVFGDAPLPTKPLDDFADLGFDDDEEEGGGGGGGGGFDCDAGADVGPVATADDEERPKKMKSKKNKKKTRKVRVWEWEEEEEVEREWEERMERRRAEWRKRVEEMLGHHRLQMAQIQARVLNEQQAVVGQLLGLVSHWAGGGGVGGGGGGDGAHVNGVVVMPGENRRGVGRGDGQEEQFILDG